MYKQLIKRKLAHLIQASNTSIINSPALSKSFQRFDENKQKEIIVWIRQLPGLDKFQIKDEIIRKFNISDHDAERLYYEAYPDGLDSQEEELAEYFEQALPQNQPQIVEDSFAIIIEQQPETAMDSYNIDPEVLQLFLSFIKALSDNRKLTKNP